MLFASCLLSLTLTSAAIELPALVQSQGPPGVMQTPGTAGQEGPADTDLVQDDEINAQLLREAEIFDPVYSRYLNDVAGYRFELRELRNVGALPSEYPPSPIYTYFPVFSALAEDGNGAAAYWLIENLSVVVPEREERAIELRELFTQLAEDHASGKYITDALDALMTSRRLLGEAYVRTTLRTIQDNSRRSGLVAKALYSEAEILVARDGFNDPDRRARADEIYRILVDGFPQTKAAKMAGSPLLAKQLTAMRGAQLQWLVSARAKFASGEPEASWGPFPAKEFMPLIQTIAAAEHPMAQELANRFFPAMEQAQRTSTGAAIAHEAAWLTMRFGATNIEWVNLKFELLDFLYQAYPNEEFTFGSVEELARQVMRTEPAFTNRALETLVKTTTNNRILGEAQLVLGQSLMRSRTFAGLERAGALFETAAATAPIERQRKEAAELGLQLGWTMPGAIHPTLNLVDVEETPLSTLSYRGKILYLYFWTTNVPGCVEDLPFVNGLNKRYANTPVSVLGINCQTMNQRSFARVASKYGIDWRNALVQKRNNHIGQMLGVSTFPHAFVIDAEGVIRARGLSHEETYSVLDGLIAEMKAETEGGPTGKGGSVRGLARYSGDPTPLPPLVVSEDGRLACSIRGGDLDQTDRSRLVSKGGGLANVVLTIHVEGKVASGLGKAVNVQQHDCRYEPHVAVVPQGATLEIFNSDTLLHGASARTLHNTSFTVILPPGRSYKTALNAVDRFELGSDSHPWMSSWVVVTDAPYYAVSDASGEFSISGLPAGKYVADWWHESLGSGETAEFEIKEGGTTLIEILVGAK